MTLPYNTYAVKLHKDFRDSPISRDPKGAPFDEISSQESLTFANFLTQNYNPDTIVGKKGLEIYKTMRVDEQVKSALLTKKYSRLSTDWEVTAGDEEDTTSVEMADLIKFTLKDMRGTFYDTLMGVLTALDYGFSISEKVLKLIEKGDFAGKIGYAKIVAREPFGYDFKTDSHGNLEGIIFQDSAFDAGTTDKPFPPERFIVYSYNKEFSNWYGQSDLREAYRSWFSKNAIMKFQNIYLERFGAPTAFATYPAGTKTPVLNKIDEILNNLQAKSAFRIPENVKMDLLEAKRAGDAGYIKAISMHNTLISRAILIPELMGFQDRAAGAQALGEVQFKIFMGVLGKLGHDIEETIVDEQIIRPLIDLNWDNVNEKQYPKFKIGTLEEEDVAARAKILVELGKGGFVNPNEEWVREYLLLPEVDVEAIKKPMPMPAGAQPMPEPELPLKPGKPGGLAAPGGKKPGKNPKGAPEKPGSEKNNPKPGEVDKKSKDFVLIDLYKLSRKPTKFEVKVAFDTFANKLKATDDMLREALIPLWVSQRDNLLKDVEKNNVVADNDIRFIAKMQLKEVGHIKTTLQNHLIKAHLDNKLGELEELARAGLLIEIVKKFAAEGVPAVLEPWVPVPPAEAVSMFNKKVLATIVTVDGSKKIITIGKGKELRYYDSQAFAIAGIERDYVLKEAKMALQTGIKQGLASKEVQENLRRIFDKYIPTGEVRDGKLVSPARLETIVRTNISDAVNLGRRAAMDDPLVAPYVPYVMWSSIIDDRTTEYCEEMDGRTFKRTDPDLLEPPAHFNCRSIITPITSIEVDREVEKGRGIEVDEITDVPRAKGFESEFNIYQGQEED